MAFHHTGRNIFMNEIKNQAFAKWEKKNVQIDELEIQLARLKRIDSVWALSLSSLLLKLFAWCSNTCWSVTR